MLPRRIRILTTPCAWMPARVFDVLAGTRCFIAFCATIPAHRIEHVVPLPVVLPRKAFLVLNVAPQTAHVLSYNFLCDSTVDSLLNRAGEGRTRIVTVRKRHRDVSSYTTAPKPRPARTTRACRRGKQEHAAECGSVLPSSSTTTPPTPTWRP